MIDLEQLLEKTQLTLEQKFTLNRLENTSLSNINKEQLLEVLLASMSRVYVLENTVKELIKQDLN